MSASKPNPPASANPELVRTTECAAGIRIEVRVTTRASRSEVVGARDGRLLVRLTAPPVDGAANAELIRLLARALKLKQSDVRIVKGPAARDKVLEVAAAPAEIHRLVGDR